jgi:hypothetical protein
MEKNKEQTPIEWQHIELSKFLEGKSEFTDAHDILIKAKEMEKDRMIQLVQGLKDYTHESHTILGHDEREASEFVDIFYNETYGDDKK